MCRTARIFIWRNFLVWFLIAYPFYGLSQHIAERDNKFRDVASLMSTLHNWGVDSNVRDQIRQTYERLSGDLKYAGTGGVLLVARFEQILTDSGTYRNLISNRIDYVGVGATEVDAEIAGKSKAKDPFYIMRTGYILDSNNSTAYWFQLVDGEVSVREIPLWWLNLQVLRELGRRRESKFDWNLSRHHELTRLANEFKKKVNEGRLVDIVSQNNQSRSEFLMELSRLNNLIQKERENIDKASGALLLIRSVQTALDFTSIVNGVINFAASETERISPGGASLDRESSLEKLESFRDAASIRERELKRELDATNRKIEELSSDLKSILRERSVPVDNLPPPTPPVSLPRLN